MITHHVHRLYGEHARSPAIQEEIQQISQPDRLLQATHYLYKKNQLLHFLLEPPTFPFYNSRITY